MDFSLHQQWAKLMAERIAYLKTEVKNIIIFGADGGHGYKVLKNRFPKAKIDLFETDKNRQQYEPLSLFRRYRLIERLPVDYYDLLWANFSFNAYDIKKILDHWHLCLKNNGLLFFSSIGEESFNDLRSQNNYKPLELHDWGDLLLQNHFTDAIVDTQKYTLQYKTPESLQKDASVCYWHHYLNNQYSTDSLFPLNLPLEVIFGHALKHERITESPIQFYPKMTAKIE